MYDLVMFYIIKVKKQRFWKINAEFSCQNSLRQLTLKLNYQTLIQFI